MNKISLCRQSIRLLYYGIYAVLCHATFILLMCTNSDYGTPIMLANRFVPMMEHSVMSFTVIIIGVLLFEYIDKSNEKQP